ncbi:unnamed protein product [Periconia digitata]|uniref:Uncharacterized protein n=1 Tax=Periconia digitata TaxID=1303443 RepID=A0A9W4U2P0_9PLEO|nr:unnamed protein product [Periconia digitata]
MLIYNATMVFQQLERAITYIILTYRSTIALDTIHLEVSNVAAMGRYKGKSDLEKKREF